MDDVKFKKKIGIMQPYFFPYIGYWQLMNAVDEYVIFDDVNYIRRGWINRNCILFNGQAKRINLHIRDASQNRLIKDTKIVENKENINSLMAMIKEAYRKAPYFDVTYELLGEIFSYQGADLTHFLRYQIEVIRKYLGIESEIMLSSEIDKDNSLKGEDKIIDICNIREADCYINAIGGKELYHHEKFKEYNLELRFLRNLSKPYKQFGDAFLPNLSMIDVMMFNDVERIQQMLMEFDLEE